MRRSIKELVLAAGAVAVVSIVVACGEAANRVTERIPVSSSAVRGKALTRMSRAEFHRKNTMDFVGSMATEFLVTTTAKAQAKKRMPTAQSVCLDAINFFGNNTRPEWVALPEAIRNQFLQAQGCEKYRGPVRKSGIRDVSSFTEEYDPDWYVGEDFHDAMELISSEMAVATDLEDLATRYGAILTSTSGMRWIDSLGVEVMLAAAMSQAEYLWDQSVFNSYASLAQGEFDTCSAGLGAARVEFDEEHAIECDVEEQSFSVVVGPRQQPKTQYRSAIYTPSDRVGAYKQESTQFRNALYTPSDKFGGDNSGDPAVRVYHVGGWGWLLSDCNATKKQRIWRAFDFAVKSAEVLGGAAGLVGAAAGALTSGPPGAFAGAGAGLTAGASVGLVVGALTATIYQASQYTGCIMLR